MPSLYANLLDPAAAKQATISSAPVKYEFTKKTDEAAAQEDKRSDAALRFQPVKRPQVTAKSKTKTGPGPSRRPPIDRKPPSAAIEDNSSSIEKWKDDNLDKENPYAAEYLRHKEEERQRARWANKKRKKKAQDAGRWVDFDQIYDPETPTRLEDYKGSEEQANAENEWKARLHAHQIKRRPRSSRSQDDQTRVNTFAPPKGYNFAPPQSLDDDRIFSSVRIISEQSEAPPRDQTAASSLPAEIEDNDPYNRRMAMTQPARSTEVAQSSFHGAKSQYQQLHRPASPQLATTTAFQPPFSMPPQATTTAPAPAPIPVSQPGVISAAPIRYHVAQSTPKDTEMDVEDERAHAGLGHNTASSPPTNPVSDNEVDEAEAANTEPTPRSNRPGQKDFAKRLLQKYGWQQGQGLGADGSGITTILRHQAEKRKKRPDAQGGGWAAPASMGRIVGGKRRKQDESDNEAAESQAWSIVALFSGMLRDLNVDLELHEGDLMQTMGDKMAEYGVVERLYIDRSSTDASSGVDTSQRDENMATELAARGPNVFVKFTSALSAYRAIQAAQDRDFLGNGRITTARFWNSDRFEAGEYK